MMSEAADRLNERRSGRIFVWFLLAMAAFVALLVVFGVLTWVGIARSEAELLRARQSFAQLENARAVDAAFSRYLLGELERRLTGDASTGESQEAGAMRGALLSYRGTIGEEIAAADTEAERDAERREMVRAAALTSLFDNIETGSMLARHAADGAAGELQAAGFLQGILMTQDDAFRALVSEVLIDERAEAADAFDGLDRLRVQLLTAGAALAAVSILMAGVFGALFVRRLMRPISLLTAAAEGLPATAGAPAVPEDLPDEFAILARRFNAMAGRIGTEQQRLQGVVAARTAELSAANESLRKIDQSRRQFFADISHELRTPVTVLLGEAQIALRAPGGERAALERVAANGRFLSRRLDDLLRLARSEDGELALNVTRVALWPVVAETVETARGYARASAIDLTLSRPGPDAGEGPVLEADAEAIRQAALALIDNAVKFSPPGGSVGIELTARGFAVSDTGAGFASTDPAALFARYAREPSKSGTRGAGLGLAIVKWIADQHGARVLAENRPEGGARVSLEFPG